VFTEATQFAKILKGWSATEPLVFVCSSNAVQLGVRAVQQFAENAKTFAHTCFIPEMLHNELESLNMRKVCWLLCDGVLPPLEERMIHIASEGKCAVDINGDSYSDYMDSLIFVDILSGIYADLLGVDNSLEVPKIMQFKSQLQLAENA